jgi:hypothetical protein
MYSKEQSIHNYSDCPLRLMRKYILTIDFVLKGNLEDHYVNFLSSLIEDEEYAEFQKEIIEEFSISDEDIKQAADKLFKIPVIS